MSGVISPLWSAAVAVISLNVDPVGYADWIARSKSGAPFAWLDSRSRSDCLIVFENTFGSNDGELPRARISPVCTSIATNAAFQPASACWPACWTL